MTEIDIGFKIKSINDGGLNRQRVIIEFLHPDTNEPIERTFSFKNKDMRNDNFLADIKKSLSDEFDETVSYRKGKFEGKTYYQKVSR